MKELLKLAAPPEPILDLVVFADGLQGEVWHRTETEEEGRKYEYVQWSPEDALLKAIRANPRARGMYIDKATGLTITIKYPSQRILTVNNAASQRRIIILTNWSGTKEINFNVEQKLVEENKQLQEENRRLRNKIGWLNFELKNAESRIDEYLANSTERAMNIMRLRWDAQEKEEPQAKFMGGEPEPGGDYR